MSNQNKEYITVAELAKLLNISRVAVFYKIKKQQIKAEKIGKTYFIPRESIPGLSHTAMTSQSARDIERGVRMVLREYSETLKLLGRE